MDDKMKSDRLQNGGDRRIPAGWELVDDGKAIRRTYAQPSFRAALAFVAWVGELAEAAEHHPDVDIRYTNVTLTLSTHSEGGLTDKDIALALRVDHCAGDGG